MPCTAHTTSRKSKEAMKEGGGKKSFSTVKVQIEEMACHRVDPLSKSMSRIRFSSPSSQNRAFYCILDESFKTARGQDIRLS